VLLGIDLGTSSVKVAVVADDGSVKEVASAAYGMDSPQPGWAETKPASWWLATQKAVKSLDPANLREIDAIGLAGQMHGVVLADESGEPVRPAILWADERSSDEVDRYRRFSSSLLRRLANPPATGMAGPTLLWLKRHESRVYESARWALQPKDWLRLQLTGEAFCEPTDASATLLYDFVDDGWARQVLDELDIRADLLPELLGSELPAGSLIKRVADELGLAAGITVAAGAGDIAASLVGHGVLAPGSAVLTIGTGAQVATVRSEFQPDATMRTHLYRTVARGKWYSMAAILNAGLVLDWVRRMFGVDWDELYGSVAQVPPGAGGVVFLPYLVRERTPRFEAGGGACWMGIGLDHGRAHLLRAALEGVAFELREAIEALEATGVSIAELQLAGGGSTNQLWRQMLADVLGKRLVGVGSPAGAARGAALLGGIAAGKFKTLDATAGLAMRSEVAAEPGRDADEYSALYERWEKVQSTPGGSGDAPC
jgi:xylulokinase